LASSPAGLDARKFAVPAAERVEVVAIVESTRADIVV
jgi:hypothetical protein